MLQSFLRLGSHDLDLNVSALRHRAFAVAAAVLLVSPAFAQSPTPTPVASQSNQIDANTNCRDHITRDDLLGDAKCEVLKGKLLDAQGKVLDNQLAAEKDNLACMQKIKPFVVSGKISRDVLMQYGSNRMCDLLKTLG